MPNSLSSKPNVSAGTQPNDSNLSDALTAFNLNHYINAVISNTIVAAGFQMAGVDVMFSANFGDNLLMTSAREGVYSSLVAQAGTMLRIAVPSLKIMA